MIEDVEAGRVRYHLVEKLFLKQEGTDVFGKGGRAR